mmetsp:Transcript_18450/g.46666  ORF Transcript_18450/g.46666 Transcript_18450/m.46666 type:complete len:393 (+) Transcript_18450:1448-2626(+)
MWDCGSIAYPYLVRPPTPASHTCLLRVYMSTCSCNSTSLCCIHKSCTTDWCTLVNTQQIQQLMCQADRACSIWPNKPQLTHNRLVGSQLLCRVNQQLLPLALPPAAAAGVRAATRDGGHGRGLLRVHEVQLVVAGGRGGGGNRAVLRQAALERIVAREEDGRQQRGLQHARPHAGHKASRPARAEHVLQRRHGRAARALALQLRLDHVQRRGEHGRRGARHPAQQHGVAHGGLARVLLARLPQRLVHGELDGHLGHVAQQRGAKPAVQPAQPLLLPHARGRLPHVGEHVRLHAVLEHVTGHAHQRRRDRGGGRRHHVRHHVAPVLVEVGGQHALHALVHAEKQEGGGQRAQHRASQAQVQVADAKGPGVVAQLQVQAAHAHAAAGGRHSALP